MLRYNPIKWPGGIATMCSFKEDGRLKLLIIVGTRPEIIPPVGGHQQVPPLFRHHPGPHRAKTTTTARTAFSSAT